jgi:hypothetical protein
MQYLTFEFDSKEKLQEVVKRLWEHYGVTGEIQAIPLDAGRWRLEVASEKELRESTLEKFAEFRVEAGDD